MRAAQLASPAGLCHRPPGSAVLRSRGCGSARSFIQQCSSHSWMACASHSAAIAIRAVCGSPLAFPSSSTSEIAPAKRILLSFIRSGPLSQGRDFGLPDRLLFSPAPWLLGEGKFEVRVSSRRRCAVFSSSNSQFGIEFSVQPFFTPFALPSPVHWAVARRSASLSFWHASWRELPLLSLRWF